jgi:hypothetical protein
MPTIPLMGGTIMGTEAGNSVVNGYGQTHEIPNLYVTYMIPADAPPSLDGHRETTYATVHSAAPFYSVLIRINPENPSSTHRLRLRPVHGDAATDR